MTQAYLAFYKGKKKDNPKATIIDRLICWIDGSDYSHVELVLHFQNEIAECVSSSNRDDGVRLKNIDVSTGRWHLVKVKIDVPYVWQVFMTYQSAKYDYLGLGSTYFPWFPNIPNRVFCSEFVGKMLGIADADTYGIRKLYNWAMQQAHA